MTTHFSGSTIEPRDISRLSEQHERVLDVMKDRQWHTLGDISARTSDPEPSVSARLRDLRKARYGAYVVERRRVPEYAGLHEYRVLA